MARRTACVRSVAPGLSRMRLTWMRTVFSAMPNRPPASRLLQPRANRVRTSNSLASQLRPGDAFRQRHGDGRRHIPFTGPDGDDRLHQFLSAGILSQIGQRSCPQGAMHVFAAFVVAERRAVAARRRRRSRSKGYCRWPAKARTPNVARASASRQQPSGGRPRHRSGPCLRQCLPADSHRCHAARRRRNYAAVPVPPANTACDTARSSDSGPARAKRR